MPDQTLLVVSTPLHRYIIRNDDVQELRLIASPSQYTYDLGTLLDPADVSTRSRRPGLVVPLRRKEVIFLIEQVDLLEQAPPLLALPPLLQTHVTQPWATGVLELDGQLALHLDVRAIARAALLGRPGTSAPKVTLDNSPVLQRRG